MRLDLENVDVRVGGATLVEEVCLAAEPGSMVGLVGPNGSGKSTVLRTVYRAARPARGAVYVGGDDLHRRLTAREGARRVAAVAQHAEQGFDFAVEEYVATGRTPHLRRWSSSGSDDRAVVADALARVGLVQHAHRALSTLSGGERQRAVLARALAQQPQLLVLDEPTNHLDLATQIALLDLVSSLGITVVTALHDLNLAAAYCDRLCVLDAGHVVAVGTPAEVLTTDLLAEVFTVRGHVGLHPITGQLHVAFASLATS